MNNDRPIVFLGAGHMASSILWGLKNEGAHLEDISVYSPSMTKARELADQLGCHFLQKLPEKLSAKFIFLGMKPQQAQVALSDLRDRLSQESILVSMMAAVSMASIKNLSQRERVVRIMPNLACRVGQSVTPIMRDPSVPEQDFSFLKQRLSPLGQQLPLDDESLFDRTTVHLSSFPAHLYSLAHELEESLLSEGVPLEQARVCTQTVFMGASKNMSSYQGSYADLKKSVISKKGVTEAFLNCFEGADFSSRFRQSIQQGQARAFELGSLSRTKQ